MNADRLRIATYNVHKCRGLDRRTSVCRIRHVIEEIEPDLLATQEILRSQAEELAEDLALPLWFGTARRHGVEEYGNATFTRLPVYACECFDLSVSPREPRQCLRVQTGRLNLFNLHLGTSYRERRAQAHMLLADNLLRRPVFSGTRIVAGDFNEWTRGLTTRLLSEELLSADHRQFLRQTTTYPGLLPFLHLDHFYYDPEFRLISLRLHRTRASLLASDHLPLVAEFSRTAV